MAKNNFNKKKLILSIVFSCSLILGGYLVIGSSNESNIKAEVFSEKQALEEIKPTLENYIKALNENNYEEKRKYTTSKFLEDKRNVAFETIYEDSRYSKTIEKITIDNIISNKEVIAIIKYGEDDWNSVCLSKENNEWKIKSVVLERER